ncbi:MAG: arginine--tRNA ligase [Hadesarchaea archaeon]|nr:arginine--tRNA ligase [Hadesarchaea archaeon]
MNSPWKEFKSDVLKALKKALSELEWPKKNLKNSLEEPPDESLGDFATTICFELPKELKKSPKKIAEKLTEETPTIGMISRVESVDGYVNFFVDESELTSLTLEKIQENDSEYGFSEEGEDEKVVIEHTSVNPTKPLHIGHGRNAILGDTVSRILKASGREVEIQNYIDDLGLQVAQTLLGYRITEDEPEGKFDHFLGNIYVDVHDRLDSEPELEEEARKILSELETGEGETVEEARELSEKCVESNLETSDRLSIDYDLLVWESDIINSGIWEETLEKLEKTPYLIEGEGKHEGTLVLRLEEFGLDDKVMVRSDGTTVYTARDLAYQMWKFGEVKANLSFEEHSERSDGRKTYTTSSNGSEDFSFANADRVINVIGMEQRFPQKVISTALKALGLEDEYQKSHHLAYEHVRLPSKKFVGRRGTWIGYSVDKVVDEAVSRAREEVEKRNPEASEEFKDNAAEIVGVGAVRYALIQSSPEKEVVFKWEEALNFERNSGPAIQYSHARASSILRKSEENKVDYSLGELEEPQEFQLVKHLSKFPEVVSSAAGKFQPHLLANYAAELALLFNKFYEVAPVIKAETEELKATRLKLVDCTKIVLENALNLLGIKAPEKM